MSSVFACDHRGNVYVTMRGKKGAVMANQSMCSSCLELVALFLLADCVTTDEMIIHLGHAG